jgi:hypothetical protein
MRMRIALRSSMQMHARLTQRYPSIFTQRQQCKVAGEQAEETGEPANHCCDLVLMNSHKQQERRVHSCMQPRHHGRHSCTY